MISVGIINEGAREAWIEQALGQIPTGSRILDAGAGEQQYKKFCSHLEYISQDFAKYDGKGDGKGLQTGKWDRTGLAIVSNITAIPEPDQSFDAIMCTEVFEHLPNPLDALEEFSRLLRKGGQLLTTAPFCGLTHFAPYHFYGGFTQHFYKYHLPKYGFEIVDIQTNGTYFEFLGQEVRRAPSVASSYSGAKANPLERLASRIFLQMLDKFARNDTGSDELLNYGYHVIAVKVGN